MTGEGAILALKHRHGRKPSELVLDHVPHWHVINVNNSILPMHNRNFLDKLLLRKKEYIQPGECSAHYLMRFFYNCQYTKSNNVIEARWNEVKLIFEIIDSTNLDEIILGKPKAIIDKSIVDKSESNFNYCSFGIIPVADDNSVFRFRGYSLNAANPSTDVETRIKQPYRLTVY